jgi:heat shock protein HslJ
MMNKILISLVAGLALLALVACGSQQGSSSGDSLTGVDWRWLSVTDQSANDTTTVPNPENYTITFHDDGTFEGTADCNDIAGTYSTDNGFSITVGPSTLAFCGEASLDQVYLNLLNNVAAGGPDGAGGLALETAGGAQRMLFEG